jgi:translation initiation factor 2 alpha subunit (eIF-2alpha)
MAQLEVGDLILCTVDRIVGTVVFVKIPLENREIEGSIVTSEIAPGRIRNLRDYVVPKKKIVCKVLRISLQGNIELSLRRVTQKEKKEVMEQESQEKSYVSILKSILGEDAEKTIRKITEKETLFAFLEEARDNPEKLEELAGKENSAKILGILNSQKKKKIKVKKEMNLTTTKPDGVSIIKKILEIFKGINVRYVAAGRYSIEAESEDAKLSDKMMREKFMVAEKEAKKLGAEFSVRQ